MQATDLFFDLPGLLASSRRTYPGVELKLQQASSEDLGRLLSAHDLDVIFRAGSTEGSAGQVSFDIAGSPLVVVCSPEQGLATKDAVSLLALAEVTLAG